MYHHPQGRAVGRSVYRPARFPDRQLSRQERIDTMNQRIVAETERLRERRRSEAQRSSEVPHANHVERPAPGSSVTGTSHTAQANTNSSSEITLPHWMQCRQPTNGLVQDGFFISFVSMMAIISFSLGLDHNCARDVGCPGEPNMLTDVPGHYRFLYFGGLCTNFRQSFPVFAFRLKNQLNWEHCIERLTESSNDYAVVRRRITDRQNANEHVPSVRSYTCCDVSRVLRTLGQGRAWEAVEIQS